MSKELEHLQKLEDMANEKYDSKEVYEHSIPIEEALQRLEEKEKIIHKYELLAKRGEKILQEDNAKPSEVLNCLLEMKFDICHNCKNSSDGICGECDTTKRYNTIKQSLNKLDFLEDALDLPTNCISVIKNKNNDEVAIMRNERYDMYEKDKKFREIVLEKNVDTKLLRACNSVDKYNAKIKKDYNSFYYKKYRLTQEEFNFLKEMTKDEQ